MKKKGLVVSCIIAVVVGVTLGCLVVSWARNHKDYVRESVDNGVKSFSEFVYTTTDNILDDSELGITYNKNTRELKVNF